MEKVNNKPWQMCRCRVGNVLVSRENPADFVEYPQGIQADLARFFGEWFSDAPTLSVHTSGSTGEPKVWRVRKEQMMNSARITCEALGLRAGDRALLCMPLDYIAGKMVVVRALVAGLELVVREPSGHPLADIVEPLHFAAMVPLQVYDSLQIEEEEKRLAAVGNLIIGGGAIDRALEERLRAMPNRVYSTYGMTETLSHIALRRLNGPEASAFYHPFPSVRLALSEEQTLVIDAPLVCDELLHTNDVAELRADGSFRILGRRDNIVSSGGIKIQLEQVEEALRPLMPVRFALTSGCPIPSLARRWCFCTRAMRCRKRLWRGCRRCSRNTSSRNTFSRSMPSRRRGQGRLAAPPAGSWPGAVGRWKSSKRILSGESGR